MDSVIIYRALGGGVMIGGAAVLLLLFNGRIAGVSNIAGSLPFSAKGDRWWRVLFLLGLVVGAGIFYLAFGDAPVARPNFPAWLLAIAGVLVGFGTSLGNGCTSGHGVCGLGRLSKRSFISVVIFLSAGIVAAVVTRHIFGVI
jgi:uncharacterized membrane protein YedE/YeeE